MDFNSSIDVIDEVTRRIKITIPFDLLRKEIGDSFGKLTRTANVKGFRPGKAPRHLLEKLYGDSVRYDVAHRLINSSLNQLAKDKSMEIIGSPDVDITSFEADKDLEFTAEVSLFPTPEVKDYKGLKVKVYRAPVADAEVAEVIERLRGSKATMKKIEDRAAARMGDVVDLTIAVEIEGRNNERPEPLVVGLGEKKIPEELEKAIDGMSVGESKEVQAATPAPGGASKPALYRVTLNAIFEKILPELDDAFVKTLTLGVETVLELRLKVRGELETEREREAKESAQSRLLDQLGGTHQFKVPQVLIDDEIRALLVRYRIMDNKKAESADLEPFRKELGEIALKRVKSAIIIDRIGEAEKIKAEKEEIDREIEQLAGQSGVSVEEARKYVLDRSRVVSFLMEISRNKVINFIVQQAQIEYSETKDPEEAASVAPVEAGAAPA